MSKLSRRMAPRITAALLFVAALGGIAPPPEPVPAAQSPAVIEPVAVKPPVARPAPVAVAPVFMVKGILKLDGPMEHGDWVWNEDGAPAGPIVVTIDLKAQMLSVFRDGYEIGTAVITYGADDKPTPLGRFAITEKDIDHVSNLYGAPMPYMLRLTNDGVSIHASDVTWGAASHGCIGVPRAFAAKLFGQARLGDQVIITNGEVLDVSGAIPIT